MFFTKKISVSLLITTFLFLLTSCAVKDAKYTSPNVLDNTISDTSSEMLTEPDMAAIEKRVSFIGCGDNIIYGGNIKDARQKAVNGGRQFNFKPMYEHVSDIIEQADIAFINQENVMAGDGYDISYYPMFNSPRELGYDLEELGFDVINIANNHMLDKGADGLQKTIEFWKGMDVLMIGGYENAEDYDTMRILEKNGIKIAFLSYTYGTNGITKSAKSPIVIPYHNDEDIIRQTSLAKEASDFVIVSIHWGYEGAFKPSDEQKRLARLMADCGVDAIVGHHPHVIQPVEWLTGKDGNKTLCVYSLGNFMAEQAYDYNMVGGIIEFDIVKKGNNKAYLENVIFNPTVFHFPSNFIGNTVYLMEDYTRSLADIHGVKHFYKHTLTYDGLLKYVTDTISPEFLPDWYRKTDAAS